MPKETNIFTFINQIQTKNKRVPFDKKIAPGFVLSLFLSMNKSYVKKVNDINKYQYTLPDEVIYNYYMSVIPKGKVFSKFIKKRPEDKKLKDKIEKLKKEYPELSTRECKMIITYVENQIPF